MDLSCSKLSSKKKGDTIIIQVIGLIDNLDKEANTCATRARKRYGLHFPELARILHKDNILYAKSVKLMGDRVNAAKMDFSQILSVEVEAELKEAAIKSTGTEVSERNLMNTMELCEQVLSLSELRDQLYDYLKIRMKKFAPNLTTMVGELVGARLIAHAGSLANLAKLPGSTIQNLGAEKALFRALKTDKHATPKHGLIYLAPLIAQANSGNTKGKMSRTLAAKAALAVRYDAFVDRPDNTMGLKIRAELEARLRELEKRELNKSTGSAMRKLKIRAKLEKRKLSKSMDEMKIEVYDKGCAAEGLITPAKTLDVAATENEEETVTEKSSEMEEGSPAVVKQTNSYGGVLLRWY